MEPKLSNDSSPFRLDEARRALEKGTGKGVRIAVIDSGIEIDHPALQGIKLLDDLHIVDAGVQIEVRPGDGTDIYGHATAVAGVIRRIAPDAELGSFRVLGENLGWGTYGLATPRSMVQGWMNSPTHRDNILYPGFDEIGVGITPGAPVAGADDALTYSTVFGKVAPSRPQTRTTPRPHSTSCIRKVRNQIRRAHTRSARVRAARAKRRCLAKAARAARS